MLIITLSGLFTNCLHTTTTKNNSGSVFKRKEFSDKNKKLYRHSVSLNMKTD